MNAAPEMNRTALKLGKVEADDVFVVGDDGEDDSGPDERGGDADDLPGYTERDGSPSQAQAAVEESRVAPVVETDNTTAPTGYSKSEYWIKPQDSLMGISLKYGVDVSALSCQSDALSLTRGVSTQGSNPLQIEQSTAIDAVHHAAPLAHAYDTHATSQFTPPGFTSTAGCARAVGEKGQRKSCQTPPVRDQRS